MTAALPVHVALVDTSGTVAAADLSKIAGAFNQQVQSDLAPAWHVAATVGAYPAAPPNTWRVELRRDLPEPGVLGYHLDDNRQPYALVDVDAGQWTVTASHELIEMLVDPYGSRLHTAAPPAGWKGTSLRVRYLLEVCDPCQTQTYQVGGVTVSDFLLPEFYRTVDRGTARYSFTLAVTKPRSVLDGGYLTFVDPADGHMWQRRAGNGKTDDHDWGVQQLGADMLRERADVLARRPAVDPSRTTP